MGIPNNYNFSLRDVKTYIETFLTSVTVDSLNKAFDDSTVFAFDPSFGDPTTLPNTLREFRNYSYEVTVDIQPHTTFPSGYISHAGGSWSTVRSSNMGSVVISPSVTLLSTVEKSGSGPTTIYEIIRSFITYDLSSIPSNAGITNAYFLFNSINYFGKEIYLYVSDPAYGSILDTNDYNNFELQKPVFKNPVNTGSMDPNRIYQIEAQSLHYSELENKFGSYIQMAIISEDDADDNEPVSNLKNGWEIDNDTYPPILRITYVGV